MAAVEVDARWSKNFPHRSLPTAYTSDEPGEDGYKPLAEFDDFKIEDLLKLTKDQLYVVGEVGCAALVELQKEWRDLERQAQHLKLRDPMPVAYKDPQQLLSREVFEERKEAALYNYKYEPNKKMIPTRYTVPGPTTDQEKFDCREPQEPFAQGGFIPTDKQYKAIIATAKAEGRPLNPDKQTSYSQNAAFFDRPEGTWIAKAMPPEAPLAPRTRARAALNGTADRQTRYNGDKVPMTRDLSSGTAGLASPATRMGTPAGVGTPTPLKRTIDAVDITHKLPPRKKHPNQYTKRREKEEAERLATLKASTLDGNTPIDSDQAPSPAPIKKKHPNQYTKRREREELERKLKAVEEARAEGAKSATDAIATTAVSRQYPGSTTPASFAPSPAPASPFSFPGYMSNTSGTPAAAAKPKHPNQYTKQRERDEWARSIQANKQSRVASPAVVGDKPKHANQYTKRREQEEAARRAALQQQQSVAAPYAGPPSFGPPLGHPYHYQQPYSQPPPPPLPPPWAMQPYQPYQQHQPHRHMQIMSAHYQPPPLAATLPVAITTASTKGKDPLMMTKEELRTHLFKDQDLIAFLHKDHSWLNEDPVKATEWKNKILQSEYPVRTWAMLRKWKEWKAEGKDKRPRDKDGNRIKDTPPVTLAPAEGIALAPAPTRSAETLQPNNSLLLTGSSPVQNPPSVAMVQPISMSAISSAAGEVRNGSQRSASPVSNIVQRLRTTFAVPGSPLVNSLSAVNGGRDVFPQIPPSTEARSSNFNSDQAVPYNVPWARHRIADDWHSKSLPSANFTSLEKPVAPVRLREGSGQFHETGIIPQEYMGSALRKHELEHQSSRPANTDDQDLLSRQQTPLDSSFGPGPTIKLDEEEVDEILHASESDTNSTPSSSDLSDQEDTDYGSRSSSKRRRVTRTVTPKTMVENKGTRTSARPSAQTKSVDSLEQRPDSPASTRSTRSRGMANGDLPRSAIAEQVNGVSRGQLAASRSPTQSLSPVATRRNGLRPHPLKRVVSGASGAESSDEEQDEKKSPNVNAPSRRSTRRTG